MISEKMSSRLISRGKKHANKFLGEKYPALTKKSLMTFNAAKNLTPLYLGKKFLIPERFRKKFFQYKLNQ